MFSNKIDIATHSLVFMIVDIGNRWKCIIEYHFNSETILIVKQ